MYLTVTCALGLSTLADARHFTSNQPNGVQSSPANENDGAWFVKFVGAKGTSGSQSGDISLLLPDSLHDFAA